VGVGHLTAALVLKRAEPKINLDWLFFAVLLSDFLLGVFYYWMGLEHAYVPLNFDRLHHRTFSFPYSHGRWGVLILMAAFSILTVVAMTSSTPPDLTGSRCILGCSTAGVQRCCILVGPIKPEDEIKITGGTLL